MHATGKISTATSAAMGLAISNQLEGRLSVQQVRTN